MTVGLVDGILDQSLVLGLANSRGLCHTQIVVGKVVHACSQVRFVGIGLLDRRFQIVRHQYLRDTSEKLQSPDRGHQKLLYPL